MPNFGEYTYYVWGAYGLSALGLALITYTVISRSRK